LLGTTLIEIAVYKRCVHVPHIILTDYLCDMVVVAFVFSSWIMNVKWSFYMQNLEFSPSALIFTYKNWVPRIFSHGKW
jgi:hypothetical protein